MSNDPGYDLDTFLRKALEEDLGGGDITSEAVLDPSLQARGLLRVREAGVAAGIDVALRVFELLDPSLGITRQASEGSDCGANAQLGMVEGSARSILSGERLALNLLGRLAGIATLTRRYVEAVEGTGVDIVDTRKTTPLLRQLEKHAVLMGGGSNHRFGLFDAILVKDNHLDLLGASGSPDGMRKVTRAARDNAPAGTFIQLEAQTQEEALAVVEAGADSVLFDNFTPQDLACAVESVRTACQDRQVILEASGGITLETVRAFAETGVDRISIGALTHSARSLDVTLEVERCEASSG